MKVQLNQHEQMLLALLRSSLQQGNTETSFFEQATEEDWKACFKLACSQQVAALAWDGVVSLPKEMLPPLNVKLSWHLLVNKLEKQYAHFCNTITELSSFYAHHGIATLLIKGVGLSTYYPKPQHREGGDIDIYTFSKNTSVMNNIEANNLADLLIVDSGTEVDTKNAKHSMFYYNQVPVENHKTFLDVTDWSLAAKAEEILMHSINPACVQITATENNNSHIFGNILIPSDEFNTLYLAMHTLRHYSVGMNLHHMCDWVCLINHNNGLKISKEVFSDKRYLKLFSLFSAFTNKYLGTNTSVDYWQHHKNEMPSENNRINNDRQLEEAVDNMLYEILRSPYHAGCPSLNPLAILVFKIKRFWHTKLVLKEIIGEPLLANTWHIFRNRIKYPMDVFKLPYSQFLKR